MVNMDKNLAYITTVNMGEILAQITMAIYAKLNKHGYLREILVHNNRGCLSEILPK